MSCRDLPLRFAFHRKGWSGAALAAAAVVLSVSVYPGAARANDSQPAIPNTDNTGDVRPGVPRAAPAAGPEDMIGLDGGSVTRLLGRPGFTRVEGPAQVWQYASRSCVLDIVFYDSKAAYLEARDASGVAVAARACLRAHVRTATEGGA